MTTSCDSLLCSLRSSASRRCRLVFSLLLCRSSSDMLPENNKSIISTDSGQYFNCDETVDCCKRTRREEVCLEYTLRFRLDQYVYYRTLKTRRMHLLPYNQSKPMRLLPYTCDQTNTSPTVHLRPGFRMRIRIRTDPHVFALLGSGQKGKEMNE